MAVSRKAMTEGLSEWASSDPLSPSVRTGAAPLGQQGEPLRFAGSSRNIRGDSDRRESLERATPACGPVRNDEHILQSLSHIKKPPQRMLRRLGMYSYRYCFMPSLALAGSSEMVMVISILLSAANLAHQATKSSAAARSAPMVL